MLSFNRSAFYGAQVPTAFSFVLFSLYGSAQSQKELPDQKTEYRQIATLSSSPEMDKRHLDTISFPIDKMNKNFYRALKLRAVYIDVPVEKFQLPDFPANSSKQTEAELDYLLALQSSRTTDMINAAKQAAGVTFNPFIHPSDSNYKYYRQNLFYVGRLMGSWFNESNLPKTADLIANVWQDQLYYMWSLKFKYNRVRPNQLEPGIKNLEQTMWPAYPSGHATHAYTNAFLLEELFPEYRDMIYKDAFECARSREVLGVHFPSDSEAGRILARQLINEMLKSEKFQKDLQAAKDEVSRLKK